MVLIKLSDGILFKIHSYNDSTVLVPIRSNTIQILDATSEPHKHAV